MTAEEMGVERVVAVVEMMMMRVLVEVEVEVEVAIVGDAREREGE